MTILIIRPFVFSVWTYGVKLIFDRIQHIAYKTRATIWLEHPHKTKTLHVMIWLNRGHWEQLSQVFRSLWNRIPAHAHLWFELTTCTCIWVIGTLYQSDSHTVSRRNQYTFFGQSVRLIDCYFLSFFFFLFFLFFITWYSTSFRNVHFPSFFTKTITILGFFGGFLCVAFSWYFYHIEIRFAIEFSIKRIVKGYCINRGIDINEAFLHSIYNLDNNINV